jgi:hypothetical protein
LQPLDRGVDQGGRYPAGLRENTTVVHQGAGVEGVAGRSRCRPS